MRKWNITDLKSCTDLYMYFYMYCICSWMGIFIPALKPSDQTASPTNSTLQVESAEILPKTTLCIFHLLSTESAQTFPNIVYSVIIAPIATKRCWCLRADAAVPNNFQPWKLTIKTSSSFPMVTGKRLHISLCTKHSLVILKCSHKGIWAQSQVVSALLRFHRSEAWKNLSSKFGLFICYHHREKMIPTNTNDCVRPCRHSWLAV